MKFLWFRCDIIIPSTALGVLVIAVALGGFLLKRELSTLDNQDSICSMAEQASANVERFKEEGHTAFILGYTGIVGRALVEQLDKMKVFKRVVLIGRRYIDLNVGPEFEQKVINFENIDEHKAIFKDLDIGFCCLGTTRGKAGKEGFIRVDHDYVLLSAEAAKAQSCRHFSLVSSQGANKNSSFLYPRTKGQVEDALKVMHFDRLSIFRPGILLGHREESRPFERTVKFLFQPVSYFFPTAITTPLEVVAMAMINNAIAATAENSKQEMFDNKAIHLLSGISKVCPVTRSQSAPENMKSLLPGMSITAIVHS